MNTVRRVAPPRPTPTSNSKSGRHVRPEELPAVREALEGYARFRTLVDQYAQLIVAETRARLEQGVKKKIQPYSRHGKKKSSVSSNL